MDKAREKFISKFLSYVLRHHPEVINLKLDEFGWANVQELLEKATADGREFTIEELEYVVANNAKKRFGFNQAKTHIRANQGHSFQVNLELESVEPPKILYHGTVEKFLPSIKENGLLKMDRQYVHLSPDVETAKAVGSRRGKPIILTIRAKAMHEARHAFYLSANGVWLTEQVLVEYIEFKTTF